MTKKSNSDPWDKNKLIALGGLVIAVLTFMWGVSKGNEQEVAPPEENIINCEKVEKIEGKGNCSNIKTTGENSPINISN